MSENLKEKYAYGLDVALRNTGVVIYDLHARQIVHSECISTENEADKRGIYVAQDNDRCIRHIVASLDMLLLKYPSKTFYAELPHGGGKSAKAVSGMAMSIGAVIGYLWAQARVRIRHVTPIQTKKLVRRKGAVGKEEVEELVRKIFGSHFLSAFNKSKREHVADAAGALAVGLTREGIRLKNIP